MCDLLFKEFDQNSYSQYGSHAKFIIHENCIQRCHGRHKDKPCHCEGHYRDCLHRRIKNHSANCLRNTKEILNYSYLLTSAVVKYVHNKGANYRGGTIRGTDTAPDEYTGYPRGGSAAWMVRFLSSVG